MCRCIVSRVSVGVVVVVVVEVTATLVHFFTFRGRMSNYQPPLNLMYLLLDHHFSVGISYHHLYPKL